MAEIRPLIAGNWKMNGARRQALAEVRKLARALARRSRGEAEVLLCPPAILVPVLAETLAGLFPKSAPRYRRHPIEDPSSLTPFSVNLRT